MGFAFDPESAVTKSATGAVSAGSLEIHSPVAVVVVMAMTSILRCLAFSGQSNSLFFKEQEGLSGGAQQGKVSAQRAAQLL